MMDGFAHVSRLAAAAVSREVGTEETDIYFSLITFQLDPAGGDEHLYAITGNLPDAVTIEILEKTVALMKAGAVEVTRF